jgi:hypothetical protein
MAVTFRGSICTNYVVPTDGSYCFVLENSLRSMCNVRILRCVMQFDTQALSTVAGGIMPIAKARKGTASASGGMVMSAKAALDSTINSPDPGVIVRLDPGFGGTVSSDIAITGTVQTMGEEFTARLMTGAEQWQSYDATLFSPMESGPIIIRPGELAAIQWVEGPKAVGGIAFIQMIWEEDSLGTGYTISGNVTLSGSAVSGAKVLVVTDTDRDMPAPELEVLTTGAPGTWTKTLASGVKASVFVQHRSGETLYTDEGAPYIAKP